jgi:hypothetical protein
MITTPTQMSELAIHKNLSTSFVSLSSLVRHLRSLQFVGRVVIDLSSYEAEIEFTESGTVKAREQDHNAGRMAFGEDALKRIMIRAKEPGGHIHVYKSPESPDSADVLIDEAIAAGARKMAISPLVTTPLHDTTERVSLEPVVAEPKGFEAENGFSLIDDDQADDIPPIPKPEQGSEMLSPENWSELVSLLSEMMSTMDDSLAKANLNFTEAFRNACGFVSFDHPFLDPDSDVFSYRDGFITVSQRLDREEMIGGVMAALGRIMGRLREDPYFGGAYHQTTHRLRVLVNRWNGRSEKFGLSRELQKIIGI